MNKPFNFKQFTVHQDRCAMKIGTDGVLLGAWTSIDQNPTTILDIGAGTGIIALQLAQRTTQGQRNQISSIDAIEVNPNAYEQCVENFEDSPWKDLLFCYHASLAEFVDEMDLTYDLIISNPPYYTDSLSSSDHDRSQARSNESMPFNLLLSSVSRLISKDGIFSIIIPYKEESSFIDLASSHSLYPIRICKVKGHENAEIKRSLIEFSTNTQDTIMEQLTLEQSRHEYTPEYIELVQDFYLKL